MALKEIIASFGFNVDNKPLQKADKDVTSFAKKLVTMFAASEIVGGMKSFVTGMVDTASSISNTATALGLSTKAFQEWAYVGDTADVTAEEMGASFKFLQKNAVEGAAAFKKLGVDIKGADGQIRPVEALMGDVADGLANVQNPAERTKLALELLGKGGAKLIPVLSKGGAEVEALRAHFRELGGGLSDEAIEQIGNFEQGMKDVNVATLSLKGGLMLALAPTLRWLTNIVASVVSYFNKGENAATRMKSAMVILGVAGAAAGLKMLAPYIPLVLLLGALYLAVQDIWTFIEGGDSATGAILTKLFGKETAESVRDGLRTLAKEVGVFFAVLAGNEAVGNSRIVSFFEEDLPDAWNFAKRDFSQWLAGMAMDLGAFNATIIHHVSRWGPTLLAGLTSPLTAGLTELGRLIGDGIVSIGRTISNKVSEWWTSLKEATIKIGQNLVRGIIEGFTNEMPEMENKLTEAGNKLIAALNKGAGNKSPSWKSALAAKNVGLGFINEMDRQVTHMQARTQRFAAASIPIAPSTTNYSTRTANVRNQIVVNAANNPAAVAGAVSGAMSTFDWNGWQGSVA
ncbi:MAG: hypothetical protein JNL21_27655 [Myxococcales bacterium]|nr:hypothetical protein [Myxococcales bacterium]